MPVQARTFHQLGKQIDQCIENCDQSRRLCLEIVDQHTRGDGLRLEDNHLLRLIDCAEICQTASNFMSRNSDLHPIICGSCAEVCLRCADMCEQFDDQEQMNACAEACRRSAESCQLMVANATAVGKV